MRFLPSLGALVFVAGVSSPLPVQAQQSTLRCESESHQTRYCDDADCQHLPSGSIVLCLADAIPEVATAVDLIILGDISPCPPGAYCLHLPLRPARLRAVLQTCRDR